MDKMEHIKDPWYTLREYSITLFVNSTNSEMTKKKKNSDKFLRHHSRKRIEISFSEP